jgi:hypothetical protein
VGERERERERERVVVLKNKALGQWQQAEKKR